MSADSYPCNRREPDRLDPRAVRFWSSTSLAVIAEEPPGTALFGQVRDYAIWRGPQPYIDEMFGMPDCGAVRRELGLSRVDAAERLGVSPNIVFAIEMGWKRLSLGSALILCERYGVSFGALYHDRDFHRRPLMNAYAWFCQDEMGGVEL